MDCIIEGCGRPTGIPGTARGYCSGHYHRWQRYADPLRGGPLRDHDPLNALARKINFGSPNDCWIWTGAISSTGYGSIGYTSSHQAMWEAVVGPVPDGLELDHLCRVRACCNPDHLEPVTSSVNKHRAVAARRLLAVA